MKADPEGRNSIPPDGWALWIAEAEIGVNSSAFARHDACVVAECAQLRHLVRTCQTAADEAFDVHPGTESEVQEFVATIEERVFAIGQRTLGETVVHELRQVVPEVVCRIDQAPASRGLCTGVDDLDDLLLGMRPGELLIVAARPGKGKTAFALQVAQNAAARDGASVLFLSLEMFREELVQRMLSNAATIDSSRLRSGQLTADDRDRLEEGRHRLAGLKIGFVEDNGTTVHRLRAIGRRRKAKVGLDLIVVDYLQLMSHPEVKDRIQEVGAISRGLKMLARELQVPVLALSQLSRAAGDDGRPRLTHLRESGALEQDADVVLMLWGDDQEGILHCAVEKNRHGRTGETRLAFRRPYFQIAGLARYEVHHV